MRHKTVAHGHKVDRPAYAQLKQAQQHLLADAARLNALLHKERLL